MPTAATHRQSPLCWQGWRMDLPERWDPAKLDGDADAGMILLADLQRPRLGVRWKTLKKNADIAKAIESALRDEVGELATKESFSTAPPGDNWEAGRAYLDPEPPGRDVWVGYSRSSGRLFEVIHHARRRDRMLVDTILPTLVDTVGGDWSIFDLNCRTPSGARLIKQRLNVGNLSLEFEIEKKPIVLRQIAVASVAVVRQSIERWLISHQLPRKKHYRPIETLQPIEWTINGQSLSGFRRTLTRRRRHFIQRWKPKMIVGVILRDESRDKLLIAEAGDESTIRQLIETVGQVA